MGRTVDTARMGRLLSGIEKGMTPGQLVELTGHTYNQIRNVRKDTGKYRKLLEDAVDREKEKKDGLTWRERLYDDWLKEVNRLRVQAGKKPLE